MGFVAGNQQAREAKRKDHEKRSTGFQGLLATSSFPPMAPSAAIRDCTARSSRPVAGSGWPLLHLFNLHFSLIRFILGVVGIVVFAAGVLFFRRLRRGALGAKGIRG